MTMTAEKKRDYLGEAKAIIAKAAEEGRDINVDEMASLDNLTKAARDEKDAAARAAKSQRTITELEELVGAGDAEEINRKALAGAGQQRPERFKSVGQRFLESDEWAAFKEQHMKTGQISESLKGFQTMPMNIGGLKALITGASETSAGALVQNDYLGLVAQSQRQLVLRDVITTGRTSSDTVEYVQQRRIGDGSVNAAAGVPEATSTANGTKPESTLAFVKKTATVETIAHWVPATKRAMSDAGQVQTLLDAFLTRGIDERIEDYILNGDVAVDGQWDGILNQTGTQAQAFETDLFTTVRKAITKVQRYGSVTGILVSPAVDEAIDLAKDSQQRFYGSGPFGLGPRTLWSYPRIVVHELPDTQIIVGDLRTAALWDREMTTITVSDSHADFFVKNLLAVLAEARAAFGILDPALLCVAAAAAPTVP